MKIDTMNFIIPLTANNGHTFDIYVPQPLGNELDKIARVLGYFFGLQRTNDIHPLVIMRDWQMYLRESLENMSESRAADIEKSVNIFLERSLSGSFAVSADNKEIDISKFGEEEMELIKGSILFLSALYRYSPKWALIGEDGQKGYFTSQSLTEVRNSLQKQSSQSSERQHQKRGPLVK